MCTMALFCVFEGAYLGGVLSTPKNNKAFYALDTLAPTPSSISSFF